MEQIVIYLLMAQKFLRLKQKILKLCLGNISKDWSIDHMKKIGFTDYVYDFCIDYNVTDVGDVKDIHKYSMKKNDMV